MKMTRRVISIVLVLVTLVSIMGIAAEAASLTVSKLNLGYMAPTNAKGTKTVQSVKLYGDYDYINFYINSKKNNSYFAYEIYADKKYTKLKDSNIVSCDKGTYSFTEKIKLTGNYSSRTYYLVTYAAKIYSDGSVDVDQNSMYEYKITVKRSADFKNKVVVLKEAKNTTKGAYVKWSKLSGANKYYIYRRSITGTKWTRVGSVSSSKTSFTDTSVKNKNANYIYSVKALNKKGTASRYLYSGLTCLFAKTPKIESVNTIYNNTVEIKWNKTSSKAKYNILRKEDGGDWKTIKTNCSSTTYKDKTAKNGKNYMYSVKAVISTDYGKATSSYYTDTKNTVTFLSAPTLNDVAVAETGISVSWNAVEGVSGYSVLRRPLDKSEGWTQVGTVDAAAAEFTDTTADLDSAYIYTVRSEGENGKGSYYADGKEFVVLGEPKVSHRFVSNQEGATISWETVDFANQYNVYIENEAGEWELYKTVSHEKAESGFTLNCRFVTERMGTIKYTVTALYNNSFETPINTVYEMEYYPWVVTKSAITVNGMTVCWQDSGAQSYNVYRRTGDENSEFVLVDTIDGVEKDALIEYFDEDVEDYIAYTYLVKGVYNGVEQTSCYKASPSYSRLPESEITRTEKIKFVSFDYRGEIYFEIADEEATVELYAYDYANKKWAQVKPESDEGTSLVVDRNSLPRSNENGEYTVSVVYVVDGNRTAFDAAPVTAQFLKDGFEGFSAESTAEGATLKFDAVEGADRYIFTYTDGTESGTKQIVVEETGESSYTIQMDFDVSAKDYYFSYVMDVVLSDLNTVRHYGCVDVGKKPEIYKGVRNSDGTVTLYWEHYDDWCTNYVVYRQVEGSTKWRKYDNVTGSLTTIKGKKYFRWIDEKAKKDSVYTYKVIAEWNYTPSDTVDFFLHPDSYYETITVK